MELAAVHDLHRQLSAQALEQPITFLRLQKKTEILRGKGVLTIGDLIGRLAAGSLPSIPSVGRSTVDEVTRRLSTLANSITPEGSVDWQQYALESGFRLVPDEEVTSGQGFLAAFPVVIDAILHAQPQTVDRLILTERLLKPAGEQMTLDEIGQANPTPVTREFVRQRQERLLGDLSNALLHGEYGRLEFHFRQGFANMWKTAANAFGERQEVDIGEFIGALALAWNVGEEAILPNLPFITSILTSRATAPHQLRPYVGFPPRLLGTIDADLLGRSVTTLPIRKAASTMRELGVATVGDMIRAAKANRLPNSNATGAKQVRAILAAIAAALNDDGKLDSTRFAEALGLKLLPVTDPRTAEEFLRNSREDLAQIVAANATSMRAVEIFRARTCQPALRRKTLHDVAQMLGCHGPTVKREETLLLDTLHRQLIDKDFSQAALVYQPRCLEWWEAVADIFRSDGSTFQTFCAALAGRWNLPFRLVVGSADPIWAVLARYPSGQRKTPRTATPAVTSIGATWNGGTVVLRGFRRAH